MVKHQPISQAKTPSSNTILKQWGKNLMITSLLPPDWSSCVHIPIFWYSNSPFIPILPCADIKIPLFAGRVSQRCAKCLQEADEGKKERVEENIFGLGGYPAGAERWLLFPSCRCSCQQIIAPSSYTWDLECKYLNAAKVRFSLILSFKYALFIPSPSDDYSLEYWVNICSTMLIINSFEPVDQNIRWKFCRIFHHGVIPNNISN